MSTIGLVSCQEEKEVTPTTTEPEMVQTAGDSAIEEAVNQFTLVKPMPLRLSHLQQWAINYRTVEDLLNFFKINNVRPDGVFFNGDKIGAGRGDFYNTFTPAEIRISNNQQIKLTATVSVEDKLVANKIIDNTARATPITQKVNYVADTGYNIFHTTTTTSPINQPLSVNLNLLGMTLPFSVFGNKKDNYALLKMTRPAASYWAVTAAARRKLQVQIVRVKTRQIFNYWVYMDLTGAVSANFGSRQNGHYYWAFPAINFWSGVTPMVRPAQLGRFVVERFTYVAKYKFV